MKQRLEGLDIARGLALLGIIANHIFYVTHHKIAESLQDYHAVLFMLLAGIMSTYRHGNHHVLKSVIRGVICIILGLAIGTGNPEVDLILLNYGLLFITIGAIAPQFTTKRLLLFSVIWVVFSPVISFFLRGYLGTPHGPNIGMNTILQEPWLLLYDPIFSSHYPLFQWVVIFTFGAALGTLPILDWANDGRRMRKYLIGGIVLFVSVKALSIISDIALNTHSFSSAWSRAWTLGSGQIETSWGDLLVSAGYTGTTFALISSILASLIVVCATSIVARKIRLVWIQIIGSATLTLYSTHVIGHMFLNEAMNSYWYYAITVAALTAFALLWKRFLGINSTGPVEAIISMIYRTEIEKRNTPKN